MTYKVNWSKSERDEQYEKKYLFQGFNDLYKDKLKVNSTKLKTIKKATRKSLFFIHLIRLNIDLILGSVRLKI